MTTTAKAQAAEKRKKAAAAKLEQTKEMADLLVSYGPMKEACEQMYPHAPNPLVLAVLVCAGADPRLVPADEPYDEHGYYQMDWQMGTRGKYPWPSIEIYQDIVKAERWVE